MADFPPRRVDDRELWAELAIAREVVGDAPGSFAGIAQLRDQRIGVHALPV
jgi:hypothetical protein